ncbi:hypothetical protein F4808DRAFT_443205 [Astrocystis sublimbata]|nr:hypothetical protein F4808DRAFT_443205 [Astrocystis sublimbata]
MSTIGGNKLSGTATDSPPSSSAFDIDRICIIGAGPSGLTSAKHLQAEGFSPSQIDIYEQQDDVGGVWNYHNPSEDKDEYADYVFDSDEEASTAPGSGACSLPSLSQKPRKPPTFSNPMYDGLYTNIPHTLMRYSDLAFAPGGKEKGTHEACEIFPRRQVVQEYLLQYAREVRSLVRFSTQVEHVSLQTPSADASKGASTGEASLIRDRWTVHSKNLLTNAPHTEVYSAVVVATGHYSTPYIPSAVPEMSGFAAAHPGVISHAKTYDTASAFANKRVVVVGSGPSGIDIASQISNVCESPLVISARSPIPGDMAAYLGAGDKVRMVGTITRFLIDERGIEVRSAPTDLNDTTGEITERIINIDAIIFCTGYLYTFPFMTPSSLPSSTPNLTTDGRRVHGLARHFIHICHPTLVFPALPIKIIPFPLAEAQAAVFSRLWANRLPLPSHEEMRDWEREDEEGKGLEGQRVPGKSFHTFPKGGDARYINALYEWSMRARDECVKARKEPPQWGEDQLWQRTIYAEAKIQFEKTGRKATTLRELGYRQHI